MTSGEFSCPVCFIEMDEPPDGYNICAQCGTEFGLDDFGTTEEEVDLRHAALRRAWVKGGRKHWARERGIE